MNIIAPVAPTVKTRHPDFIVAIASPEISELLSPYMLGVLDAERGEVACPEMYFTQRGQMCEYCEGFEAVAGATLTTRHFLPPILTDAQMQAETDDYESDMLDREYHARGAW